MTGIASNGYQHARKIFESGRTLEKFREIIAAQGGDENVRAEDIAVGDKNIHPHVFCGGCGGFGEQ